MVNYSIDASVYAYPFQGETYDVTDIERYYDIIQKLYDLIFSKHPQYKKFYLFEEDMKLIRKFYGINFTKENISNLNKILKSKGSMRNMEWVMHLTEKIISRMDNEKRKNIMFEAWFNIEDVKFKDDKYPSLPEEVNKNIINDELIKNTTKNIAKIAYLNEYVYKNNNIHNIILNDCIKIKTIDINIKFDIKMNNNYIIKNAPLNDISIENKNIYVSTMAAFIKNNFKYNSGEWEKALNDAKEHFKDHLEFEYTNIIKKEAKKLYGANKQKFNEWMEEGPNTLYENLKALDNFITNSDLTPLKINKDKNYHCCRKNHEDKCEFLEACGSNIRYFGVDCVDEFLIHKNNKRVEEERTRKNNKGGESIYWIHLRPQRMRDDTPLGFLTLRIHFRPLDAGKIEIGWIGRHLFLPSRT